MRSSRALTVTLAGGMLFLAARAALQPRAAARAFGVALPDEAPPTPFMLVKADRDATLGALLLAIATFADAKTLRAALLCGALAPLADATLVVRYGKPEDSAVHLATVAYILTTAWLAGSGR